MMNRKEEPIRRGDGTRRAGCAPSHTPTRALQGVRPVLHDQRMALVLVVDDEPTARAFARMVLLAGGHEVVEAKSGEEALDRMAERPPDCIVLDLVMPGLSGLEMMEVLGGRSEPAPIVVVTASMDEADRGRCFRLGARAFVSKPVSRATLARAVREALAACDSPASQSRGDHPRP
jgi:CheY-like chemotaxis protein